MKLISNKSKADKKRPNRRKKGFFSKLSNKEKAIFLFPAMAAILAIIIANLLNMSAERYTLTENGVRYYAGSSFNLDVDTVLKRTSDDITIVDGEKIQYTLDTLPIYYNEQNAVLFAENMVYVDPRENEYSRLDYFSEVRVNEKGDVYASRDGEEVYLRNGYAFDGEDIYIFFEDVVIEYNGYRMELPALSYVEAVFTGDVFIYNSKAEEQFMEAPIGDVIVTLNGADFKLSLLEDSMESVDGNKQLIFTRPEVLESIF